MSTTVQYYRFRDIGTDPRAPALTVYFDEDTPINAEFTKARGIQVFDSVLIAYVAPTGQPKSNSAKEIERTLPDGAVIVNQENSQRFAEPLKLYKSGIDAEKQGTPLKELIGMSKANIMNLKSIGVHTLEMLADCPDSTNQQIMGFWDLRDRAKKHIELREKNAPALRLESALAEKDAQIAALQAQLNDLAEAVKKRGPGRPRKEAADEELEAA